MRIPLTHFRTSVWLIHPSCLAVLVLRLSRRRKRFPARQAGETLEIDDTLAEAHAALAYCLGSYDWNWTLCEGNSSAPLG